MADPFSIAVGAIAVAQTSLSLTKFLIVVKDSLINVGAEADDAMKELSGLMSVCESVRDVCQKINKDYGSRAFSEMDTARLKEQCGRLAVSVEDCKEYVKELESLFFEIFGPTNAPAGRRAIIKSSIKHLLRKDELLKIRRKITTHHSNIQSQMISLNSSYQIMHFDGTRQSLTILKSMDTSLNTIQNSMFSIQSIVDQFLQPLAQSNFQPSLFGVRSIPLVNAGTSFVDIRKVLDSVQSTTLSRPNISTQRVEMAAFLSENRNEASPQVLAHSNGRFPTSLGLEAEEATSRSEDLDDDKFVVLPSLAEVQFMGRMNLLTELVTLLNPLTQGHAPFQKRVVISGMGGIGKTRLALALAHKIQQSFFGIVWIDASSHQRVRACWAEIARIFGVEADFQSGLKYLASVQKPWLLIMDNADDADILIEEYLPSGDLGCVVITTRLTSRQLPENFAQNHYHLDSFSNEEGLQLLLTETGRKVPLSETDVEVASEIAHELRGHPLAISQAAAYIRTHGDDFGSYLEQYRQAELAFSGRGNGQQVRIWNYEERVQIVSDLSLEKLDDDAKQILDIFAFFQPDNIPVDIFLSSVRRGISENVKGVDELDDDVVMSTRPHTPTSILHHLRLAVNQLLQSPTVQRLYQTPPVLPNILRLARADPDAAEKKLQSALMSLEAFSFIVRDDQAGMFRMHRLIQEIIRKRFYSNQKKAVACEAALIILADNVELQEETLTNPVVYVDSRFLLPHIIEACQRNKELLRTYEMRQIHSGHLRSLMPRSWWSASTTSRPDPVRLMKFSFVYFDGGEYQQARLLQEQARSILLRAWGTMLNPQCVHTSSALALTYHRLYLFDEAVELQRQTIHASEALYGKENRITLSMTDILGLFCLSRGDLSESIQHSQQALSGLEKLHGNEAQHKTTLVALNHLGVVQAQYYRWKESKQLCTTAMKGLQRIDPEGSEIWFAKQNVAIADIQMNNSGAFEEAEKLLTEVLHHWRLSFGNKHPTTLLATFNMSRVLLRRGKIQEAEDVLLPALEIAESRLGSNDFGFLAARVLLACIKLHQRNYARAEQLLLDVNDSYVEKSVSRGHFDRITVLWYLTECYKEQGKFDEALEVYEEASDSIKASMSFNLRVKHPLAKNLSAKRQELDSLRQGVRIATMRAFEANLNSLGRTENTVPEGSEDRVADRVEA